MIQRKNAATVRTEETICPEQETEDVVRTCTATILTTVGLAGPDGTKFWHGLLELCQAVRVNAAYYSPAEQAQHAGRPEQNKRLLLANSATPRKFNLLGNNAPCQMNDAGTQFILVDMKVPNDFLAQAKCGSCCAGTPTFSKAADKEYGSEASVQLQDL